MTENRDPPSGFAAEINNKCQIKSKLLHIKARRCLKVGARRDGAIYT